MRNHQFPLFIIFFLFFVSLAFADVNVTDCMTIGTHSENYTLANDITAYDNCFMFNASGVTVDCQGHKITGNGNMSINAFYWNAPYFMGDEIIKNCVIENIGGGISAFNLGGYSIYGVTIINNTFTNLTTAIGTGNMYGLNASFNRFYNISWGDIYVGSVGGGWIVGNDFENSKRVTISLNFGSNGINVIGNMFINGNCGVEIYSQSLYNIYNNYFNDSSTKCGYSYNGNWNTTIQTGVRIINSSVWDTIGGNFYSDFSENCTDINNDGFCDNFYIIDENNIDYLPLATHTSYTPPCNCTELKERVENLENKTQELQEENQELKNQIQNLNNTIQSNTERIGVLEFLYNELQTIIQNLNSTVQNNIDRIIILETSYNVLQSTVQTIQDNLNRLIDLLTYSPRSFRHDMICGYMRANSITSFDALGLHCEINDRGVCNCRNIV